MEFKRRICLVFKSNIERLYINILDIKDSLYNSWKNFREQIVRAKVNVYYKIQGISRGEELRGVPSIYLFLENVRESHRGM